MLCYHAMKASSGRPDDLMLHYVQRVKREGARPEDFKKVYKKIGVWDAKLANAIAKKTRGALQRKIALYNEQALLKEQRTPTGRELWCIVVQWFATETEGDAMFAYGDVAELKMKGDNLAGFLDQWDMVLAGLRDEVSDDTKLHILRENVN